jgi:hypothetical protein
MFGVEGRERFSIHAWSTGESILKIRALCADFFQRRDVDLIARNLAVALPIELQPVELMFVELAHGIHGHAPVVEVEGEAVTVSLKGEPHSYEAHSY